MAGGASVLGAGRALLGARRRSFTHGTRGARRASRRSDAAAAPGAVALFGGLEKMLKGDPATKTRERYQPRVDAINKLAPSVAAFTDDELRAATAEFQKRAQSGESLDALLPEAFAVRAPFSPCSRRRPSHPSCTSRSPRRARAAGGPTTRGRVSAHRWRRLLRVRRRWCARHPSACSGCGPSTRSSSAA